MFYKKRRKEEAKRKEEETNRKMETLLRNSLREGCKFFAEEGFVYSEQDQFEILNFTTSEGGRKIAIEFVKEMTVFLEVLFNDLDKSYTDDMKHGHLVAQEKIVLAEASDEIELCVKFLQGLFTCLENLAKGDFEDNADIAA